VRITAVFTGGSTPRRSRVRALPEAHRCPDFLVSRQGLLTPVWPRCAWSMAPFAQKCPEIQRFAPQQPLVSERRENRARNAKKQPMARCPLACLFSASVFVAYDTLSHLRSIFLWQQDGRCQAIRFRQNPYPVTGARGIRRQNAKSLLD
jgi:hypothetical protein